MDENLKKEFQYYLDNQNDLIKKYNGKVIVIKNGAVIGAYNSDAEALEETTQTYELGTFLVQKCEPGDNSYKQTYYSRVAFA